MTPNRVLILFIHPAIQKSRVNRAMANVVKDLPGVTFRDLYELYPDFMIDVEREKSLLLEHDVIVFQHPIYWYSAPSLFKEWCDLVLEYGFAYGEGGTALKDKQWLNVATAGGMEDAYAQAGLHRFTIREFFTPIEQTARLCHMRFLDPYIIHGSLKLDFETGIPRVANEYRVLIERLKDAR